MKQSSNYDKAHADVERIFRTLLPAQGLTIRQAQIELCHEMLDAMFLDRVTLCDAGVGIGKTYAYLIASVLWQNYHPRALPVTVTISTSSIALQNAILKEYLPLLSQVFVKSGMLAKPIRAVLRKGRERYVCDQRLAERQRQVAASSRIGAERKAVLKKLEQSVDLDETTGLSAYDRAHVCVPSECPRGCAYRSVCRYQAHLCKARSAAVTIQVCNHNYLLADANHRLQGIRPLLKDYHILIVDEAHKLPGAAQQIYGQTFALDEIRELCALLNSKHRPKAARTLWLAQQTLTDTLRPADRETEQEGFVPTPERVKALNDLYSLLKSISSPLIGLPPSAIHQIEGMRVVLADFRNPSKDKVLYLQYEAGSALALCAVSRNVPEQIERSLWRRGNPAILTSGTLAAGGSFARAKHLLGLEKNIRCREFTALSPFDYEHNSLLYLAKDAGSHSNASGHSDTAETAFLTKRIRELVLASHGHALVLFTSYSQMSEVCKGLKNKLPFPVVEAWRGNQQAVRQFKEHPNAVLCAAGPCWEGIDFPGDMVSLLVIARLPFPVPTPTSDAEREQYPNLQSYIRSVVIPEMQTKLRQGVGRAIRTETDTCVVAILDKRAAPGGRYHADVRNTLPPCPITTNIKDAERFIRARKGPDYFLK